MWGPIVFVKCHYTVCRYAECHYAKCHYAECHKAKCHYNERHKSNVVAPNLFPFSELTKVGQEPFNVNICDTGNERN